MMNGTEIENHKSDEKRKGKRDYAGCQLRLVMKDMGVKGEGGDDVSASGA